MRNRRLFGNSLPNVAIHHMQVSDEDLPNPELGLVLLLSVRRQAVTRAKNP